MRLRQIARKLLGVSALFALLVASIPALAESLSASNLPACCSNIYCPMRYHQAGSHQKNIPICGAQGNSSRSGYSMRACGNAPLPFVGTAPFVLMAPFGIRHQASAEPAQISRPEFFPFVVSIPSTPPPRTLLS
jgi:hypothetical protein